MISVKRVMILGGSGAGKTYLAMKLSKLSQLPTYHVDQLSWQSGFIHQTTEVLDALTRNIHNDEHWILEGGHYETCHERARRAQLLIWIEAKKNIQALRIIWRSLRHHGKVRPGMGEGCPEKFGPHTLHALQYAKDSREFHRERALEIIASAPSSLDVLHLRNSLQVGRFLRQCKAVPHGPGFTFSPTTLG